MPLLRSGPRLLSTLVVAACLSTPAFGVEGGPQRLEQEVAPGVVVDWTGLTIRVTAEASGSGTQSSRKAVEQLARRKVGPGILAGARDIRVTSSRTFADLEADASLADQLDSRVSRWAVRESRYYMSGRVELVGELSIQELLKPWLMSAALPDHREPKQPRFTGLVVDARGTGATPALAPRVVDELGQVLYHGSLWEGLAVDHAPVVYVADPAHPAATRAGGDPLFIRASGSAAGCDLVLDRVEAQRFRTAMSGAHVLGEGTVVVVLDPPS